MLDGDSPHPHHFRQGGDRRSPAQGDRKGSPLLDTLEMSRLYIHCTFYETVYRVGATLALRSIAEGACPESPGFLTKSF